MVTFSPGRKTHIFGLELHIFFTTLTILQRDIHGAKTGNNSVLMVCFSNYVRSPIAAAIFKDLAKKKGVDSQWYCDSAAIVAADSDYDMDPRAKIILQKHGIQPENTPREVTREDFFRFDYMLAVDEYDFDELKIKSPFGCTAKMELLTSYDPEGAEMIMREPHTDNMEWYETCYQIAYRSCNAFLDKFSKIEN